MALYLDINGFITETGGSNFLIYKDGKVISPKPPNILWGISLQTVTEILKDMGVEFIMDDITAYDAVNSEEAFVPTSPYCLGPVTKINGNIIGDGKPGRLWREILDRWSRIVDKDIYNEMTGA
jgi:branched-chain amino acid aminotransferase